MVKERPLDGGQTSPGRRLATVVLTIAWLVACLAAISAASAYTYFEPTEEALATAASALTRGEIISCIVVLLGAAAALVRNSRRLFVLVLPGVVGLAAFVAQPDSHGLPLVALLLSTIVAGAVAVAGSAAKRPVNERPR